MSVMSKEPMFEAEAYEGLEEMLGHRFSDPKLLRRALTHSSYANEARSKGVELECNERLEFLGDSVLSIITSDYLFRNHPEMPEGDLSKVRAGAVCEKALSAFARQIGLGKYIYLGRGEVLSNGRDRTSILADAFEAVLAALYLDGGIDAARHFVLPFVSGEIVEALRAGKTEDYKTVLQQIVQQEQGELLEYVLTGESGPAHCRVFEVEARLNSNVIGRGSGHSKREAEQKAAHEAVILFGGAE